MLVRIPSLFFGAAVIPETPRIVHVEFGSSSAFATLRWKTSDVSVHLRAQLRLRSTNGSWVRTGLRTATLTSKSLSGYDCVLLLLLGAERWSRAQRGTDAGGQPEAPD